MSTAVPVRVVLPSPLWAYTNGRAEADATGATLAAVLADLDRQFPGIRFRMIDEQQKVRPHIKLFVNRELERDLSAPIQAGDEVMVVAALSGG